MVGTSVLGQLDEAGSITLDEPTTLKPGPVRVWIESLDKAGDKRRSPLLQIPDDEWDARKKAFLEMPAVLSNEEAREMQELIDHEFGQIDPDAWR